MKNKIAFMALLSSLFVGCIKRHKSTIKVCNNTLNVEVFNINPAGVDAEYLMDSVNFRLYIGKLDSDHERYSYTCQEDTVCVKKIAIVDMTGDWKQVDIKTYNIKELKKNKVFE
ncbi:hypothetical protein ACQ33O_13510 [Ferruginibacter sp. SUN002]|uniref:hypothetical protein n=1 Tax=Ferruginibacter sp. SUN002 TaxID=2937789 RepID=UPI003D366DCC